MAILRNLITAVEEVNDAQKLVIAQKIITRFGEDLTGFNFCLFGAWPLSQEPMICEKHPQYMSLKSW